MPDVFLSYAEEDRPRAEQVAEGLRTLGWDVWWDVHIYVGTKFRAEITRKLESAKCVVVLWSRASLESDWVIDEAEEGRQRGVLVQALIEDVQPPHGFRGLQWANLSNWDGDFRAPSFARLHAGIAHRVAPESPPDQTSEHGEDARDANPPPGVQGAQPKRDERETAAAQVAHPGQYRLWSIAAIALAIVVAGGVAVKFRSDSQAREALVQKAAQAVAPPLSAPIGSPIDNTISSTPAAPTATSQPNDGQSITSASHASAAPAPDTTGDAGLGAKVTPQGQPLGGGYPSLPSIDTAQSETAAKQTPETLAPRSHTGAPHLSVSCKLLDAPIEMPSGLHRELLLRGADATKGFALLKPIGTWPRGNEYVRRTAEKCTVLPLSLDSVATDVTVSFGLFYSAPDSKGTFVNTQKFDETFSEFSGDFLFHNLTPYYAAITWPKAVTTSQGVMPLEMKVEKLVLSPNIVTDGPPRKK